MIHWPNGQIPLAEWIDALCKVKKEGLAKNIGVANFNIAMLDEAAGLASEPIAALQIEAHPYLDQSKIIAAARRTAWLWSAIVRWRAANAGRRDAAEDRPRPRQDRVASRLTLSRTGPHHSDPAHLETRAARGNLGSLDFKLSEAEMAEIGKLRRPDSRIVSPPQAPKWD